MEEMGVKGTKPYNTRHRCFYFSKEIILFVKGCRYERVYSSLFDQLIRSATSVGANVVEAKAGSSKNDWKKFLVIALKSANEVKYWLCLIRDTMSVDQVKIKSFYRKPGRLRILLHGS